MEGVEGQKEALSTSTFPATTSSTDTQLELVLFHVQLKVDEKHSTHDLRDRQKSGWRARDRLMHIDLHVTM